MALTTKQKEILNQFIEDCKINKDEHFRYVNPWTHMPMDVIGADQLHDDHWKELNAADEIPEVGWTAIIGVRYLEISKYLREESQK